MTNKRIKEYVSIWSKRGYPSDIPDEVPHRLMQLGLAPSYKAIALAILNNDLGLTALGYSHPKSGWYSFLKVLEISAREGYVAPCQRRLF